jgi:acylphosphatase
MLVCPSRLSHYSSQNDNELIEMKAQINGNVHGVGFRAETKFLATRLQLKGSVRNCPDGSVEIIAQGTKATLEALISELKKRFKSGHIDDIQLEFYQPRQSYEGFNIKV